MRASVEELLATPIMRRGEAPDRGQVQDEYLAPGVRLRRVRQWARFGEQQARLLPWINLNPAGNLPVSKETFQPFRRGGAGWNMVVLSWRWGFDGCIAYNAFPFEEKDPSSIRQLLKVSGEELLMKSHEKIAKEVAEFDAALAGWGADSEARLYAPQLLERLDAELIQKAAKLQLWCIKKNGDGSPKNPTYTSHDAKPVRFRSLGRR